jgi:hypothetical protein
MSLAMRALVVACPVRALVQSRLNEGNFYAPEARRGGQSRNAVSRIGSVPRYS